MSNPKPSITIVGLGLIGGSLGLALREAGVASAVTGHDKDPGANSRAKKLGAVDRTDWNLISACEKADLIILATPSGAIEGTLQAVSSYLRPGCVVMDTASIKEPVLAWAADALPDQVHFVGGDPILTEAVEGPGGLESARADLFRNGLFCLIPSPTAEPAAVKLANDLVTILGAKPLFLDAAEHDGLLAAVDQLPAILAVALLEATSKQPSWRELRKVAGAPFEVGTRAAWMNPADLTNLCMANRDNVVRWIDIYSSSLASIRQSLVEAELDPLTRRFRTSLEERAKWLHDREQGQWESGPSVAMPERSSMLADAFLGGLWRKRPKQDGPEGQDK